MDNQANLEQDSVNELILVKKKYKNIIYTFNLINYNGNLIY